MYFTRECNFCCNVLCSTANLVEEIVHLTLVLQKEWSHNTVVDDICAISSKGKETPEKEQALKIGGHNRNVTISILLTVFHGRNSEL